MSEKIVQLNEEVIKGQLKELVRGSVEETLNDLLEQEAEKLTQAARYERNEARQGYRSGHYSRNLTTTSGDVTLHVPCLKGALRYRRRESSVEEALIEMYLAGVSVRRVEDITEALWGSKVSPAATAKHGTYYFRPFSSEVIYVDGIYLRRNWGGEYENAAVLVAIAVNEDGYREVLGAAEGMKEDKASWISFFQWLRGRGLDGVKLVVGDKCLGMLEAVGEVFPVEAGVKEALTYCGFPSEHWTHIRTNHVMERLNREIRRRTRAVGCFPDGNSALMLACARLRHVAGTQWGNKKYMNMKHLEAILEDVSIAG